MEIEEKDKETLNDQPYCSNQQQINEEEEEDKIKKGEKQPIDKMTLLQQALSQASVTRAKRCKQQRLALSEMKKCDKINQLQTENRLFQSNRPSEETFHETSEFMEVCSSAIKNHKLFPIVEVSIPLWNAVESHSSTMQTSLTGQKTSDCCLSPTNPIPEKNDAQESVEEESCDSKRKAQLPAKAVELLKTWLFLHSSHPYPSENEKAMLSRETGLQMVQINNWFINARRRILIQSKETLDTNFIQESSSNIDNALIAKRIR
ncbi:hypothetical protein LOAG_18791, partial [Loa loa]